MAIIQQEWHNQNENRNYPFDDNASRLGHDGTLLPNDIIADCNITFPSSYGSYLYVSSVVVSNETVSVTFLATDTSPYCGGSSTTTFRPIAAITVVNPSKWRNYAVDALVDGVAGWVAFGTGVYEHSLLSLRFETPAASMLTPRSARGYEAPPVTSLRKEQDANTIQGTVLLTGADQTVIVEPGTRVIDGTSQDVVLVGLDLSTNPKDVLRTYAGDCGGRPDSLSCAKQPFLDINGVRPNESGNLDVIFPSPIVASPIFGGGGIILDHPLGLGDVCTKENLVDDDLLLPYEPSDSCTWYFSSSSSSSDSSESISSSSNSSSSWSAASICEDWEPPNTPWHWDDLLGTWTLEIGGLSTLRRFSDPNVGGPQLSVYRSASAPKDGDHLLEGAARVHDADGNAFLVFGFEDEENFWFAGFSTKKMFDGSDFKQLAYIGRRTSDSGANWDSGLGYGLRFERTAEVAPTTFQPGTDYYISVELHKIGHTTSISLRIYDYAGIAVSYVAINVTTSLVTPGLLGIGVADSYTEFDNIGWDCGTQMSSSSSSTSVSSSSSSSSSSWSSSSSSNSSSSSSSSWSSSSSSNSSSSSSNSSSSSWSSSSSSSSSDSSEYSPFGEFPTSATLYVGSYTPGTAIVNLHAIDSSYLGVIEVVGTPGYDLYLDWQYTAPQRTQAVKIVGFYEGNPAHNVKLYQRDYLLGQWVAVTGDASDFPHNTTDQTYQFTLGDAATYVSIEGHRSLRFLHTSNGLAGHQLNLNYVQLLDP